MKSWTNNTGAYLYWGVSYPGCVAYDSTNNNMMLVEHTDYTSSSYEYRLLLVNLTSGSVVKVLWGDASTHLPKMGVPLAPNLWYVGGASQGGVNPAYIYDAVNDTFYPTNASINLYGNESFLAVSSSSQAYVDDATGLVFSRYSSSNICFYNPCFLSTINNLESPVTKDVSQTMKVTYTLTEV